MIPPEWKLAPKLLERVGAESLNPPCLYTAFSICIECPLFSRQNHPFLWYWFPFKIGNLDTNLLYVHPCEKVIGMFFFQNQIWSRLLDINRLCLVCIKRSIEEVQKCQISKHGYHQGPSDETLIKAYCDVKFGHRIMEAVGFFDYKMHSFIQITVNFTNMGSKGVVWWFTEMILHKWIFF